MSIAERRIKAIATCDNCIDLFFEDDKGESFNKVLASVMDEDGCQTTDREREIANHIVEVWNNNIL